MGQGYDGYEYDDYGDDYNDGMRLPVRAAAVGALVLTVTAVGWFGLLAGGGGGSNDQIALATSGSQPAATTSTTIRSTVDTTSSPTAEDERQDDASATEREDVGEAARPGPVTATVAPAPSVPSVPVAAPPEPTPSYDTLPDGSPVPVLAMFDGDLITISGVVPSEAAGERLRVLALANSTVPNAEVASFVAVDASVPVGVGVRVIEMNSARFPEGSPTVSAEHAAQLDRIVVIMTALPHVTVDVIGHADQRGDDETNFELSTQRARSAADYLAAQGIDPTRLSSRGAGESDLLTLNSDEAALALNRRTEFVFFGLLLDAPEPS